MDIFEKKTVSQFNNIIKWIMANLRFKDYPMTLIGSASLVNVKYFADFDLKSFIDSYFPKNVYLEEFKNIINKIDQKNNVYFLEFKIQDIDGKKIKINDINKFDKDFKKILNSFNLKNLDFMKIDLVIYIDDILTETSINYEFRKADKTDNLLSHYDDEIKELTKDGNYYKALKRYFSVLSIDKNENEAKKLLNFFNGETGKKYFKMTNLETVKKLAEQFPDNTILKNNLIKNLKAIKEPPETLNNLDKAINTLYKEINTKSKKVFQELYKKNKLN